MRQVAATLLLLLFPCLAWASDSPDHLAAVRAGLQQLAIDSSEVWRVRDLELSRGGAKIYFSEGVLAFATPVDGHRIAAVFTTDFVEAGDAEIIALPPVAAERSSLARFTQSPNLDEHFTSALLFFADDTAEDLLHQIHQHPLHPAPDLAAGLASNFNEGIRNSAAGIDVRISQSILDHHGSAKSFFYCLMAGRTLGALDLVFQPDQPDPLMIGRIATPSPQESYFQIWSAFRPANLKEIPAAYQITDYKIDATIHPDLSLSATADFDYLSDSDDGAVITLLLTPHLRVTSATIDDHPASVVMHDSPLTTNVRGAATFLAVSSTELPPGTHHRVKLQYQGSVISRTSDGTYFVDDRNAWYPFTDPMLTTFDLTFHFPANLRLVSTGDPVAEDDANGQRMVHRRTVTPHALAGFNIGDFNITTSETQSFRIEICSNPSVKPALDLAQQTSQILAYYTARWLPLASHNLAVTPIEGYFGQGFPGLIYLSNVSYLRERDRPLGLRNPAFDTFFSQLLLPHELAHQWWGNIVTPASYRSNWIVEAMSNYAALQYLEQSQGRSALDAILAGYRKDLTTPRPTGELIDSYGPVTFGQRLLTNFGAGIWHDILYEKGTWIFHLLRSRMGDEAFHNFQLRLLKQFAKRPITNDDLRQEAAHFIPSNQADRQLTAFFDTWIYDTGVPRLSIKRGNLLVAGVPETYSVDVPLNCHNSAGPTWFRASEGSSPLPARNCVLPPPSEFLFGN